MIIPQNGKTKAVAQDLDTCEVLQETLALLKILALGNQLLEAGQVRPVAEVIARLRQKREND